MADEQEEVPPLDDLGLTGFGYDLPPPTPELTEQRRREQDYIDYMAQFPGYQTILDDTRKNYTPKGWIKSPVHLPRFTNDEFEEMKKNYQAKYGSTIVIPKFEDTIHWQAPPTISTEEYAAHKYAQRRGMPSPLTDDQ